MEKEWLVAFTSLLRNSLSLECLWKECFSLEELFLCLYLISKLASCSENVNIFGNKCISILIRQTMKILFLKKKARKLADLKYANIRQWWGLALYEENICKEKLSDWWQSTHLDRKHNRNAWSALHPSGWPQYSLHGTTPHNYHIHCQNMKPQFLICFLFFQK